MKPTAWLKANKHDLAPLTGQDRRALEAFAAIWELLATDSDGRRAAIEAAVALLPAMQPKCWPLAKELIARSMDWGDRERVWSEIEELVDNLAAPAGATAERFGRLYNDLHAMRFDAKPAHRQRQIREVERVTALERRTADKIDGYDRDDLGPSEDDRPDADDERQS